MILLSIKPDKLYRLKSHNPPISSNVSLSHSETDENEVYGIKVHNRDWCKQLLNIYLLSKEYTNSGSLKSTLSDLDKRLREKCKKKPKDFLAIVSVLINITIKNPDASVLNISCGILSTLLSLVEKNEAENIIAKIEQRYKTLLNADYFEIWLQRIKFNIFDSNVDNDCNQKLCHVVITNDNSLLWNNDWIKDNHKLLKIIKDNPIIDQTELGNAKSNPISRDEIRIFEY